jgi:F-type H+-transporting ATPase subunit b
LAGCASFWAVVSASPVIDIDGTLFIQAGIYIGLILILNPLLFKPWLAAQARRREAIDGAFETAKELRVEADALSQKYDASLADARDRALAMRSRSRREEEATQAGHLAAARDAAGKELDATRKTIARQADEARTALAGRIDELAMRITDKVLSGGKSPS